MLTIRPETSEDVRSIRYINEQAFGRNAEAEIVEKLRKRAKLAISLVAVENDKVVGHIAFSPVAVESKRSSFGAVALATMAVLPEYQHKGVGSQLVLAGLKECRLLGYEIIVVVGHPDYYPRFGFVTARSKGIECEFPAPDEAWMLLELNEGGLAGRKGTVKYQPEFQEAT